MKIIAITGTKGKSSIARLIDFGIRRMGYNTVRVDTDGCFFNGTQKFSKKHSQRVFGNPPTVRAGKYIKYFKGEDIDYGVLEQSLSSGRKEVGLGYKSHYVSVFSNILFDHLDYKTIKSEDDIFLLKENIIRSVKKEGWVVINLDDRYCTNLEKHLSKNANKIYYGISTGVTEKENYVTIKEHNLVIKINHKLLRKDISNLGFPFNGPEFFKSNLMASIGALLALGLEPGKCVESFKTYKLDNNLGRLLFINKKGVKIIFDTSHDPYSIIELGKYCKTIGKKVIGVLRFSPERVDQYITNAAEVIGNADIFDLVVIYDFIDGVERNFSVSKVNGESRGIGETAEVFYKSLKKLLDHSRVKMITNEQDALKCAFKNSKRGDCILMIHHRLPKDLKLLKAL